MKVEGVKLFGKQVYGTPNGIRVGSKGHVIAPSFVFGKLNKGNARKLRKALRAAGFNGHAAQPREVHDLDLAS